ncbi:MAG: EAL domain-containing protein [Yokenella regensburgei]|jgi:EAL domain-containing protein (putative c-di-GMP-specific phosphodiesterase class I)|uniref:Cyclic di-GMP regulator CdgR n=1 Tax=Yokenella regensburgei TaxID=158877 RepID=A0AB38G2S4_9ENTR|nr:EAL domain-containing protein [Yokenella regensburgei]EHM45699.1 cyclic di-GMP regulator CdgR [Yokenella regensburgei ATCC 43003]KFD21488.1 hypothetical protein GYRE_03606 [Yokenella regensburgei ATCC 49455]MDQ4428118.1 EAL domain-containing protein [Yokenella regensburgei]MDR3103246.1 EAL domain-containing protein [Yokenella regensburgei]QIU89103.1 EAL domain-containing protein [Yokenella regensburgei]
MIVSLDNTYRSDFLLLPARNFAGGLVGLEIITHFTATNGDVRIPTDLVIQHMTAEQELMLFKEKLAVLATCQLFFIQHQLLAWINITPAIALAFLNDELLVKDVKRFPFLELTVNENYPGLNQLSANDPLFVLAKRFNLVLANFGAGDASTKAIFAGVFSRIQLDRNFVQRRVMSPSFEPFMRAIVTQMQPYCATLMIAGVDSEETLTRIRPFAFSAMQGMLWPPVPPEQVTTLVQG